MRVFLDTHVAVAVHDGLRSKLSAPTADLMERSAVFVSPGVVMELQLLHEIGRLHHPSRIVAGLAEQGVHQSEERLADLVPHFGRLAWTRDPFDRLIVATALLHRAPLVTLDRRILHHVPEAIS